MRMCTRVWRACMIEENRTHDQDQDQDQDTRPEYTTTGKGRTQAKRKKPEYICMIAGNEKKYKKKLKKIWN